MRWREHDHPRDGRGRFARKAGGGWAEAVFVILNRTAVAVQEAQS